MSLVVKKRYVKFVMFLLFYSRFRYLAYRRVIKTTALKRSKKVIAMTLYDDDPRHTWGAIRNAQLAPVVFPGWRLRVYVPREDGEKSPTQNASRYGCVPPRIVRRLRALGAEIIAVDINRTRLPARWWAHLTADDRHLVDYFVIRRTTGRLTDDDFRATEEWVALAERWPTDVVAYCLRDAGNGGGSDGYRSPMPPNMALANGLWGGRPRLLKSLFGPGKSLQALMAAFLFTRTTTSPLTVNTPTCDSPTRKGSGDRSPTTEESVDVEEFLRDVLWPLVASRAHCVDAPRTNFRSGGIFAAFDEHEEVLTATR